VTLAELAGWSAWDTVTRSGTEVETGS
jgi:hypothetical protein